MGQVREALTRAGANWAALEISGRRTCQVSVLSRGEGDGDAQTANDRAVTSNEVLAVDQPGAGRTVADLLRDEFARLNGGPLDDLEISFVEGREEDAWLGRSAAVGRYELEPLSRTGLGRVPVKVRRYSAAGTVEEVTLTAEVARRARAVVATRQLRRGERFSPDNLALRPVLLTSDHGRPLDDLSLLTGQHAAATLREGTVLRVDHVAPDVLVKRGDLVTVAAVNGSLVVRTVGRASEDGVMGDLIAVRHEQTRETFYAVVSGPRQATVTRDVPHPASHASKER